MIDMITLVATIVAGSTLVFGTIAIWILMGYYSVRILRSFKGGILSKGWKFICIAVPFLIFGQLATGLGTNNSLASIQQEIFRTLGGSLSLIGGIMIVVGFRAEYRAGIRNS
jgi:hypothetical protein